jgi:ethanolamine permease
MFSFCYFRRRSTDYSIQRGAIVRPFRSPFDNFGVLLTIAICVLPLAYQFYDPLYQKAAIAALAWYLVGVVWFAIFRRSKLVLSPEEQFAMTGGKSGRTVGERK